MSGVILMPYDSSWPSAFASVRKELLGIFAGVPIAVEHIGSTSVPGLSAKPVLDVLLGAPSLADIEAQIPVIEGAGYEYRRAYEENIPSRRYFVRSERGVMRVHLHAVVRGQALWQDHLRFREALRNEPSLRDEYQTLKLSLAKEFGDNKRAYTDAKAPFIRRILLRLNDEEANPTGSL